MTLIYVATGSIMTTTGEFKPDCVVGPGGYKVKTWKTRRGAEAFAKRRYGEDWDSVIRIES